MSIQSKIDFHLSKQGGFQYNIVIRKETGPMKLPKGVNVSLYDCIIDDIDATEGDNSIFLGGDKTIVKGKIEQKNGNFGAENCVFNGEINWRDNTRVKLITKSKFMFRVSAWDNTYVDIFDCDWDGFGSFAIRVMDHSRVTISKSLITKRTKGVWAEKGSFVDLTNCTIATETGIYILDNCQVNMIGGDLKPTKIGVEATNKCQIYLSHLDKPVTVPSDYDVKLDEWSTLKMHGTDMQNAKTAIEAKNYSTIDIMDFNFIKSTGNDCIILKENSTARIIDGKVTIESEGASAISAEDRCTVNCVDVLMIEGKGKDGVVLKDNHTKFEATGRGNGTIKGVKAGIRATNKCSVSVDHYTLVKGESEDGVILTSDCQGYFAAVQELTSDAANGALLTNESDISFQDHGIIRGKGKHGIEASNNCTVNLQTVQQCIGDVGDGIHATNSTEVDVIYTDLINGKTGIGINAEENCDVYVNRSTEVTGMIGGIKNISNGSLDVELVTKITPQTGVGILTQNKVDTKLALIGQITFGTSHSDCEVKVKDCNNISNSSGPAVSVTGGEATIQNIVANGSGSAMSLVRTYAKASGTTLNQSLSCSQSEIELNGVTLNGSIISLNDTISINRGVINGNITGTGSTINLQIATVNGAINANGGTLDLENTLCSASLVVLGAHLRALLTTVPGVTLTSASAHLMGGAYGVVTLDPSSTVIAQKAACTFAGGGGVISMESGPLTPGLNGMSVIGPVVTLQDAAQDSVRLTAGALTITSPGVITLTAPAVAVVTA
jgi:hypothetical protein